MDLAGWPVAELDPVFHLALHIGNAAWRSAVTDPLDRSRCGVDPRATSPCRPRRRTPSPARSSGRSSGCFTTTSKTDRLNRYSTGLPAALVARGLGFGLGGYALDAACASSLYALKLACDELLAGRADAMIAGGLSRPDSLYTQMGFAQLRALSPTRPLLAVRRRAPTACVVGEGGCAFVLKRLSDAVAHGDTIHGVIAGIGLSNDVGGQRPSARERGPAPGAARGLPAGRLAAGRRATDRMPRDRHADRRRGRVRELAQALGGRNRAGRSSAA